MEPASQRSDEVYTLDLNEKCLSNKAYETKQNAQTTSKWDTIAKRVCMSFVCVRKPKMKRNEMRRMTIDIWTDPNHTNNARENICIQTCVMTILLSRKTCNAKSVNFIDTKIEIWNVKKNVSAQGMWVTTSQQSNLVQIKQKNCVSKSELKRL